MIQTKKLRKVVGALLVGFRRQPRVVSELGVNARFCDNSLVSKYNQKVGPRLHARIIFPITYLLLFYSAFILSIPEINYNGSYRVR